MAWADPKYERKDVDRAGSRLAHLEYPVTTSDGLDALTVLNNWRSSHAYPLNTFQITLRTKARKIERDVIVAQRVKRLESIHAKLSRQPSMRMTQMQDIAGCRAVFKRMASVKTLIKKYKTSSFDHKLRNEKDYITFPKKDGYRCHHMVYSYKGNGPTEVYDGLQVEVQIRTQMQHAWATAVEAVGIFTKQALKSNQGDQDWLRFFALMGSAIAAMEACNPVPNTPTDKDDLVNEIRALAAKLRVQNTLSVYNTTIQFIGSAKDAKYFVLSLDPTTQKITVWRFKALQSEAANQKYTDLEGALLEDAKTQIVLVSVDNVNALRRAYPNYFLDTNLFSSLVARALKGDFPNPLPHSVVDDAA
ncbi:GTP pyrophosphokinase YjbM [Brevundimonas sp. SH203]|nr:GTP pyrophosphokinase YjbM [Brevundimonas sp. SH203]